MRNFRMMKDLDRIICELSDNQRGYVMSLINELNRNLNTVVKNIDNIDVRNYILNTIHNDYKLKCDDMLKRDKPYSDELVSFLKNYINANIKNRIVWKN